MEVYKTKIKRTSGTSYREVYSHAKFLFKKIASRTKRKPYLRSHYFKGEKVFLDYFWDHLSKKKPVDRFRRLKQYLPSLDLIQNTRCKPETKDNPNDATQILHRFKGCNGNNEIFYVQITEEKKSGKKHFLSVFPETRP